MAKKPFELGDAELGVLKVLWDHGPATVRDVLTHLHAAGRRVAYTTVQTLLTRIEGKGFAKSNKADFAFVYRAAITRDKVTRSRLKTLVRQLYDGAAAPLVMQLIQTEDFTTNEIDALHELIENLDSENKNQRGESKRSKR